MTRRYYIAVIHKDSDSDYSISFPDLPCVSAGDTFEDAIKMGEEAATVCVEAMTEIGQTVPDPSAVSKVLSNPDYADGRAVVIGVDVPLSDRRAP